MSAGRTTPRTVIIWCSELTWISLEASTTRPPLGSTWVTRAVSVVVRVVVRLVVPCPFSSRVSGDVGQVRQRPGGLGDARQSG